MKIILMQCPVLNYKILLVELAVKLIKNVYLNETVKVPIQLSPRQLDTSSQMNSCLSTFLLKHYAKVVIESVQDPV